MTSPREFIQAAADRLLERIATCHERVACPACGVRVGHKCIRRNGAWGVDPPLKHPHLERQQADGIRAR